VKPLIVVENPKRWPLEIESVEVVAAKTYLVDRRFSEMRRVAVYNLCRRLGYQSLGYYVSLLATARGHRPLPDVATAQALGQAPLLKAASEDLEAEMQRSLGRLRSDAFTLSIYFGRNVAARYDRLARALFNHFPAPFLIARFAKNGEEWRLAGLRLGAASDIPDSHRDFVIARAGEYFAKRSPLKAPAAGPRYDLAVLWSPDEPNPPSDERAIRRFVKAAARHGIGAEVIGPEEYGRLAEYDALFIRETTYVNHHTYRFATRALAEGLVVIDHPESIIRATNKVYQAELFARHGIPHPRTHVFHDGSASELVERVGLPCVLKKPDGAFSIGVVRVATPEEAAERLTALLAESELVLAQEFTPSDYDWRIGVLDKRPLFAARYHMVRGHWQIASHGNRTSRFGRVEAVALADVPESVVSVAVRAASLFGEGLFGVDVKAVDGRVLVMEVNDNPNLDAGLEDGVEKSRLWDAIADWFKVRLDGRGNGP